MRKRKVITYSALGIIVILCGVSLIVTEGFDGQLAGGRGPVALWAPAAFVIGLVNLGVAAKHAFRRT